MTDERDRQAAAEQEQTLLRGCSCCDPTSDSPDPVVVRLERENEELRARLAAAEAERDDANRRFNEMNTPTGREIELAHALAECRRLLRDVCGVIERNGERSDDGCFMRVSFRKEWYEAARAEGGLDE